MILRGSSKDDNSKGQPAKLFLCARQRKRQSRTNRVLTSILGIRTDMLCKYLFEAK